MKTKIYFADISPLLEEKFFTKKYAEVSDCRKAKIDKMKFQKDKCLSLGAGLLLKQALSECGIEENSVQYSVGENGKPKIDGIEFNLSHSEKIAMCAVSDFSVGCDVELIKDADLKIADRFFTETEVKQINGNTDTFFRLWTLKESFIKATGLGMSLPLNQFCIHLDNGIEVEQNISNNRFSFFEFDLSDYYKFSCCIENSTEAPEIIKVIFS